jgi:hypothetical protein
MGFRLHNLQNPHKKLRLSRRTWFGLLELAEAHGWNPMGTAPQEYPLGGSNPFRSSAETLSDWDGSYWEERQVLLDDALNLMDALTQAYEAYEPIRLPSLYALGWLSELDETERTHPSLGALEQAIAFCQGGAFRIEPV